MKLKIIVAVMILASVCCFFTACGKYDDSWIIGKNSAEIIEKYGKFDFVMNHDIEPENGLYRNTGCGYLTKESQRGFFGTSQDEFFMIYFDANGVAYEITKDYPRPGG